MALLLYVEVQWKFGEFDTREKYHHCVIRKILYVGCVDIEGNSNKDGSRMKILFYNVVDFLSRGRAAKRKSSIS